jgi:regulator of cell morphogenesis and NO signaling
MHESFDRTTVGDVVAADFRAAGVFEQFGIDFCCGGRRSLADACRAAGADPAAVRCALDALPPEAAEADVRAWPADRLVDQCRPCVPA